MNTHSEELKKQILAALSHVEAEEGLYFNNLIAVHEEEERLPVMGNEEDILDALKELIDEGKIRTEDSGEQMIFHLKR